MSKKMYQGLSTNDMSRWWAYVNGVPLELRIMKAEEASFKMGQRGTMSKVLARSILFDYFGGTLSAGNSENSDGVPPWVGLYAGFKERFVYDFQEGEIWEITDQEIETWLEAQTFYDHNAWRSSQAP